MFYGKRVITESALLRKACYYRKRVITESVLLRRSVLLRKVCYCGEVCYYGEVCYVDYIEKNNFRSDYSRRDVCGWGYQNFRREDI